MNLPDTFPKQLTITLAISMERLMNAGICEWGRILKQALDNTEATAVEQIRDLRQRMNVFRYCGSDPGEGFETDYRYAWVDIDGAIQLLRLDMLPLSERTIDFEMGFHDGTYEEVEEDGEIFIRKVEQSEK